MISHSDENAAYARVKDVLSEMIATTDEEIDEIVFDVADMKEEDKGRGIDEDTPCVDEGMEILKFIMNFTSSNWLLKLV